MSEENDFTIYKSSYWNAHHLFHFFVNHNFGGHGAFSFVIKKDKFSFIYNLKRDESVSFAKSVIKSLSRDELAEVLKSVGI